MNREIAVYQGDDLLAEGTVAECAQKLGVKPGTIRFYLTPSYMKRCADRLTDNYRYAVRLDDDDEGDFEL